MLVVDRDALRHALIQAEGLRLKPYTDTRGRLTIGVGRNLTDVGISQVEAMTLLDNDIDLVLMALPIRWTPFAKLDAIRQQAIAEMAFNLGVGGLMLFTHMLAALATGNHLKCGLEARNSAWYTQVGSRRGERIAIMLETGALPL